MNGILSGRLPVGTSTVVRHWLTVVAIGALFLLSLGPIVGHHFAFAAFPMTGNVNHIMGLCAVALRELFSPVHFGFHLLLLSGLAFAIGERFRAWGRARGLVAKLHCRRPVAGDRVYDACHTAGVSPAAVRVAASLANPAFTIGLIKPRIYIASDACADLSDEELVSVIRHEKAHMSQLDPLRLGLLRFMANLFFWLPVFRQLAADFADETECLADDRAVNEKPLVLASAIIKLARYRVAGGPLVTGLASGNAGVLERRIRRLIGERVSSPTHVSSRALSTGAGVLAVVWLSGVLATAPAGADKSDHCRQHHGLALGHLFCDRSATMHNPVDCPHDR